MSFELYANARKRNEKCTLEMIKLTAKTVDEDPASRKRWISRKMNSGDTPSPVMIRLKTHEQFLIAHAVSTVLNVLLRRPLPPPRPLRHVPVT